MSHYRKVAGYQSRLAQAKRDAKEKHPYPNDQHLLQHPNPTAFEGDFGMKERILDLATAKTKKYYSRKKRGELITVNHWGQRKLLMSEIEFLTRCTEPGKTFTIVYAGAAPGSHTNYLADMFPDCKFVLVDPAPFVAEETKQIKIIKGYMTDEIAEEYKDTENVMFVSDIRTANPRVMSAAQVEERVKIDNQMQVDWIEKMNPIGSLLKFRCPYYDEKEHKKIKEELKEGEKDTYLYYEYYKGDVYLPVWGPQSTTECRLYVPKDREMIDYDIKRFEEQLFYFNNETRVMFYPHNVKSPGLDHCFDCRSEVKILRDYLAKFKDVKEPDLDKEVEKMIPVISEKVATGRSGRTLQFIEPTRSDFVPDHDFAIEKAYSRKLVGNAPDQRKIKGKKRCRGERGDNEDDNRYKSRRASEGGRKRRILVAKRKDRQSL